MFIEREHPYISITRQAELLGISRASLYYKPIVDPADFELMRRIDEIYTKMPFLGSRRIKPILNTMGYPIGRKRVRSLMKTMGIEAIYPKPNASKPHPQHKIYPYLLRDVEITGINQAWGTDITFIRLLKGWCYLVAIMDWFSRYVLAWELSTSLEDNFCIRVLEKALLIGTPEVFNSDQGSQFTSNDFTSILLSQNIQISMDGRGRAMDNIFTERLWRSLKYEEVYIKDYQMVKEARQGIDNYFFLYNTERPHQSLGYMTPAEVYYGKKELNCIQGCNLKMVKNCLDKGVHLR